ncbi:MAG: hypothetical protein ABFD62_15190 [Syntrophaceae bacterium]
MNILIIDPNATFRESCCRFLQSYFPLMAIKDSDEQGAMQTIRLFAPDMVVMSMNLELARDLKLNFPGIVLIVMVPDDLPEYLDAAYVSGADHIFSKHCVSYFEINRLLKIISRMESEIKGYIRTYP